MLKTLTITNFRCFQAHQIRFTQLNVAVGHNNAGKSTVAEALRIISVVTTRFRGFSDYHEPPSWLTVPRRLVGFKVSLDNLQVNFESMFHRYGEGPATLEADFGSKGRVRVYVGGARRVHCVLYDGGGTIVTSREKASRLKLPPVLTLPQVGPVVANESVLNPDYVRGSLSSRLAPIHFRNQLNLLYDLFPAFQDRVESTWPGLQVVELIGRGGPPGEDLHLQVRDGDFVAEVGLMGHGLQMWLQTMWFLTRADRTATVVLDEPDVYMHADLQRKLIRYVRERYAQVIITTHSTEIMSEVSPESIIVVDRARPESASAETLPAVQRVVTSLGSVHNVHLARLWAAKRFLLVEGKDRRLLKAFQDVAMPGSSQPLDALPNASIGGWGGWRYALGSSLVLENAAGKEIVPYCILDSDFHNEKQIGDLHEEFRRRRVHLKIWTRKEIENYLLVPSAIHRAMRQRPASKSVPSEDEIRSFLEKAAEGLRDEFLDGVAQEILAGDRGLGVGGANREARGFLEKKRGLCGLLGCMSGKSLLSALFRWAQEDFGRSLSPTYLIESMALADVDPEVLAVLQAIEKGVPLNP